MKMSNSWAEKKQTQLVPVFQAKRYGNLGSEVVISFYINTIFQTERVDSDYDCITT